MERKLLFCTEYSRIYIEGVKFIKVSLKDLNWQKEVPYTHVRSLADDHQKKFIPKLIRFINPNYEDLFMLLDGGQIKITHSDGEEFVMVCKYIDEYHLYVGSTVFHICEFAERMERIGATYQPT